MIFLVKLGVSNLLNLLLIEIVLSLNIFLAQPSYSLLVILTHLILLHDLCLSGRSSIRSLVEFRNVLVHRHHEFFLLARL